MKKGPGAAKYFDWGQTFKNSGLLWTRYLPAFQVDFLPPSQQRKPISKRTGFLYIYVYRKRQHVSWKQNRFHPFSRGRIGNAPAETTGNKCGNISPFLFPVLRSLIGSLLSHIKVRARPLLANRLPQDCCT